MLDILDIFLGLMLLVLVLVYYFCTRTFSYWRNKGVVFVKPYPLVGSVWKQITLQEHISDFYRRIYFKHLDLPFIGYYQGLVPSLIVHDADLIKNILIKDFSHFTDHSVKFSEDADPLFARNLFSMKGQQWRYMRTKLSSTFTASRMKLMFPLVLECAEGFESYLQSTATHGNLIDLKVLLSRYTTNVIASSIFGVKCDAINEPYNTFAVMSRKMLETDFIQGLKSALMINIPGLGNIIKASLLKPECEMYFRSVVQDILHLRASTGEKRNDFLQLLIDLKDQDHMENDFNQILNHKDHGEKLTETDILAQAMVFFFAGFETSSSAMTFALFELSQRPELQHMARSNIEEVLQRHDNQVTYEALQEMTYLDWILKEALRKFPPIPIFRECTLAYTIPGTKITIDKGTPVNIPIHGLHYDPKYFYNPEEFIPERFSEKEVLQRKPCTFLTFGEGPRTCIGQRFAYMQSKLGLFAVLRKFEVQLSSKTKLPLVWDPRQFVLTPKDGIHVTITSVVS